MLRTKVSRKIMGILWVVFCATQAHANVEVLRGQIDRLSLESERVEQVMTLSAKMLIAEDEGGLSMVCQNSAAVEEMMQTRLLPAFESMKAQIRPYLLRVSPVSLMEAKEALEKVVESNSELRMRVCNPPHVYNLFSLNDFDMILSLEQRTELMKFRTSLTDLQTDLIYFGMGL